MEPKKTSGLDAQTIIIVVMSILLLCTAIFLFFERSATEDDTRTPSVSDGTTLNSGGSPTTDDNADTTTEPIAGDDPAVVSTDSKYTKFGECKDYDTKTPYFVKTYLGNYKYTDGGYVGDYCVEEFDSSSLVEFMCIDGEISSDAHRCPYGCLLGACMTEIEERAYVQSSILFDAVVWEQSGIEYEVFAGYVGKMFAPINIQSDEGNYIEAGTQIYGLALLLNVRNTNESDTCAPLSMDRIIDETGKTAPVNTNQFHFGFEDNGCVLPAKAATQYKVIFLLDPLKNETDFIISAGGENRETFIVTHDQTTGEVDIEKTVPLG